MNAAPAARPSPPTPAEKAATFLAESAKFRLGHLPTESRHPKTTRLSQLAQTDLPQAIRLLQEVELDALKCLPARRDELERLSDEIKNVFTRGGRVFLCGCGATGRLSLSLETLWREAVLAQKGEDPLGDKVISFIAGGDYALVRSIENFEDHPEYGARQLRNLGFSAEDLLIGTSEGGETPFVIGAVQEAALISSRRPYFIYCNPSDVLARTVERSREVIENPRVVAFALETGPMAVAGSTRLQATTALMLGVGAALFSFLERPALPRRFIDEFVNTLRTCDFTALAPLIQAEASFYQQGGFCVHETARFGITVVTDTTERSPTFSLLPFEFANDASAPMGWTYLVQSNARECDEAWEKLLHRKPRPLDWPGFRERYGKDSLKGFDFSRATLERRRDRVGASHLQVYKIEDGATEIRLEFAGLRATLPRPASLLCEHLLLKVAMNISSTLAMGLLGRFSGNLMLYVRAANNKLVDRAIRYVQILLEDAGDSRHSYEDICHALFNTAENLPADQPVVLKTFEALRGSPLLTRS